MHQENYIKKYLDCVEAIGSCFDEDWNDYKDSAWNSDVESVVSEKWFGEVSKKIRGSRICGNNLIKVEISYKSVQDKSIYLDSKKSFVPCKDKSIEICVYLNEIQKKKSWRDFSFIKTALLFFRG